MTTTNTNVDLRLMSEQQKTAGKNIVDYYNSHASLHRWAVLLAQMQSGKTETYLFIAAEMIRLKRVLNVVIFSGNAETALRDQIQNILQDKVKPEKSFYRMYLAHLATEGITADEANEVIRDMRESTTVVWGTELGKFVGPTRNTLFIWEESHYAQNVGQMPAKMFRRVGISANGDAEMLSSKGNYVVSVSATGFSELSDNAHYNQSKWIELLKPGAGYNSVETMLESNRIVPYSDISECLEEAMSLNVTPKYAVIRASRVKEVGIVRQLKANGWKVVYYDNNHDENNKYTAVAVANRISKGEKIWNKMDVAPRKNTAIILKGLCRMGQNVEKTHVSFFMETADGANADTLLQSFIGRSCGYSAGSDRVHVYIPEKIFINGDLERYVLLSKGKASLPNKSRNIVPLSQRNQSVVVVNGTSEQAERCDCIIPIKISKEHIPSFTDEPHGESRATALKADVRDAFVNGQFENFNSAEVLQKIIVLINNPETELNQHNIKDKKGKDNATYANMKSKLEESFTNKTPLVNKGTGCGVTQSQVNIWVMANKDVYIDCVVARENPSSEPSNDVEDREDDISSPKTLAKIPKTTGKEVFRHKMEDGSYEISNGGFSLSLTPLTAFSTEQMLNELSEVIEISLKPMLVSNSRSINSVKDSEYKGISLNAEVLAALQPGGAISEAIVERFQLQIKITKMSGPQSKAHKAAGLTRIAKISW
jgi:hypothetical protein